MMNQIKKNAFFLTVLFFSMINVVHALPQDKLSEANYQRWINITQSIRCMVCQNQSVYDSYAPFAKQLKMQIADQLATGVHEDEIYDVLLKSYGNAIMLKPPMTTATWWLWCGPFLFFLMAVWFLSKKLAFRR